MMKRISTSLSCDDSSCPVRFSFVIVFILFLHASSLYSQPYDSLSQHAVVTLPAMVVTATRIPTISAAVNRTYEILHPSEMNASPPLSLEEVLRNSSLSGIQSRGVFGVQTDVSIRGSTFSQNLVLLNGQRLNDPQTGHHTFDLPVAVDDIERIEIVKGNASTQYGADACAGVLNIITRRPLVENLTLRMGGGEHGLLAGLVSYTTTTSILKSRNTFEGKKSDGFRDDTEFVLWNITTNNELHLPFGDYTLLGGYTKKKFGAFDFYSPGRNAASKEKTAVGWMTVETVIAAGPLQVQPKFHYRRHDDEFVYMPGSTPNTHTTFMVGGEITGTVTFDRYTTLLFGGEANGDKITSSSLGDHKRSTKALFGTFQTMIGNVFSFDIGLRQDWHSEYSGQFSPNIGIGYLFAWSTKVFASTGKSFRAPSYTELYYNDPANIGNPNLSPETGWSYELGFRNSYVRNININGAIFLRQQENLIDYVQFFDGDQYHAVNFTAARTRGGELGVEWLSETHSSDGDPLILIRSLRLDYLYLDSKIDRGISYRTKYSLNHPRHTLSTSVSVQFPARFEVTIAGTWKKRTTGEAYTLIDLSINKGIPPLRFSVKAQNLFNIPYEEIVGVPQPGRWIWGTIEVEIL